MKDREPDMGIFCHQIRLSVMGLEHQPSQETFYLQLVLPAGYTGAMVTQNLWSGQTMTGTSCDPYTERELMPDSAWVARSQKLDDSET